MKKMSHFCAVSLLLLSLLATAAPKEELLDTVVAVVNKEVITESQIASEVIDLQTALEIQRLQNPTATIPAMSDKALREQALTRLIDRSVQLQYAKRVKIEVSDVTVDETIADIAQQNNMDIAGFTAALESQGLTLNDYRNKIRRQLIERDLKQNVVAPRVNISAEEVQAGLKNADNPLNKQSRYLVHDYRIELSDNDDPKLKKQAKDTADIVMKKMQLGQSPSSDQAEFIDLGWRSLHELPEVFAPVVKGMKKGETHLPLVTANGYHVLHLADVQAPFQNHKAHEYKVRHILMKSTALLTDNLVKVKLADLKKEVEKGADFSKLARKYSEDYNTAHKGGDMGWLKIRELPKPFIKPVSEIKSGQVSEPFKGDLGWHLLYIENVRDVSDTQAMRELETKNWLFQQKIEEESREWLAKIKENSFIKIEQIA